MRFGTALQIATLLAAGAAFGTAAVGGNLHPVFVLGWFGGWAAASLTPEGRFAGRWVLAAGLFAGPVLGAAIFALGLDVVLAAIYFAAILLLARLFTRQGVEGHGQVHLLSILVLSGGAAVSPDLTFLPVFVVYLFAVTFGLLLNHLRRESGEAALALPVREVAGAGLLGGTFLLGAFAIAFTAATFVIFPRTTFGLGMARAPGGAQVGLTDRIDLAGFGRIKENDRVVLRVEPEGDGTRFGDALDVYWRAQVLEVYDDTGWRSAARNLEPVPRADWRIWPHDRAAASERLGVEVVSQLGVPVLPVPDRATRVRIPSRSPSGDRVFLRLIDAREVRTVGAPTPPYRFTVDVDRARRVVDDAPPGPEHLALPDQHPAIVALAARLDEEAGHDPVALAAALEGWLMSRFEYALDLPADPSLTHFLLERRAGHCEYFATAMAVLLRLRGVPARVVVGFHGGRLNESGGYYTVRQGDAHAWVEVWQEGTGWLRYDPTPELGRGRGTAPPTLAHRLADWWDALQVGWIRNVLGFDRGAQRTLGQRVAHAFDDVARALGGGRGVGRDDLTRVLAWAGGVLGLVVVAWVVLRRRGVHRASAAGLTPDARRAQAVYRALLRAVAAAGITRNRHQTADEVLAEIAEAGGEGAARRAASVVSRYHAARFGGRALPVEEARALTETARRIGASLEKRAG